MLARILILVLVFTVTAVKADEAFTFDSTEGKAAAPSAAPVPYEESLYLYTGVGLSTTEYPKSLRPLTDALDHTSTVSRQSINLDLVGVYLRVDGDRTLVGLVASTVSSRWNGNAGTVSINQYQLSVSVMHALSESIGHGPFLRADLGPAVSQVRVSIDSLPRESYWTPTGLGVLVGGGYAFPLSEDTRLLAGAYYNRKSLGSEYFNTLSATFGFLF